MSLFWAAISVAMVVASFGAVLDGMPRQIIANWRGRTASPVLRRFLLWGFAAYALRALHTASRLDYLTALAALPGALGTAILLLQQRIYPSPVAEQVRFWLLSDGRWREVSRREFTDTRTRYLASPRLLAGGDNVLMWANGRDGGISTIGPLPANPSLTELARRVAYV
jgi:hypothetical protein